MKKAYLTIDDAPTADFRNKVDYLKGQNIPAIFYCVGNQLEKYKDDVIYAIQQGFIIGNHSFTHADFSQIGEQEAEQEIGRTEQIINQLYKEAKRERPIKTFRFPFLRRGEYQHILEKYNITQPEFEDITYTWYNNYHSKEQRDVICTFNTKDWAIGVPDNDLNIKNLQDLFARIDKNDPENGFGLNQQNSNEIIIMHDIEEIKEIFVPMIEYLKKKNLQFVSALSTTF